MGISLPSCRDCSEYYLFFINGFLMFLSLVVMGLGAFLVANVGEDLSELDLNSPIVASVVFGVFLFLFSLCGIFAAIWDTNRWLLAIYIIGSIFICFGVLAAGVALLSYTSFLENLQASDLQFEIETFIMNYELAVFEDCCAVDDSSIEPPVECPEEDLIEFPCFTDSQQYNDFRDFIGERTCNILSQFFIDDKPIVGPIEDGGCGEGDAKIFVERISQFIEENLQVLGAANIGLSIMMLLMVIAACTLFWQKDQKRMKEQEE